MRTYRFLSMLFLGIGIGLITTSCDKDDDMPQANGNINQTLMAYKWVYEGVPEFGEGDGSHMWMDQETITLYFTSETEGVYYWVQESTDTDLGFYDSSEYELFTYTTSGNTVTLDGDESLSMTLMLQGDMLVCDYGMFNKKTIYQSDREWLEKVLPKSGTSGTSVSWAYSEKEKTLTISGNGAMANYSNGSQPWNDLYISNVEIKEGVTSVGNYAFYGMSSITDVDLPSSLEIIGDYAFSGTLIDYLFIPNKVTNIGDYAVASCDYLTGAYMPENVEYIGDYAFADCDKASISLSRCKNLKSIGAHAFNVVEVTDFTPSEVLVFVGRSAFMNLDINKLVLPNSLETINNASFGGNFNEIRLGSNVSYIENNAFISTKSGSLYINRSTPPTVETSYYVSILNYDEYKWNLYVPKGAKAAYFQKAPWDDFKEIIEDSSLSESSNSSSSSGETLSATGRINGHDYVDLGLPSGTKWATCNVGANKPEGYGKYFAWGETSSTWSYTDDNCYTDGKRFVDISGNSSHDAATANWGGSWRMPKEAELNELKWHCDWTWTIHNGVNGYIVKSKTNGNRIFLPAAGWCFETELEDAGDDGLYWSSAPHTLYTQDAYGLHFDIFDRGEYKQYRRYFGLSVRPVSD